MLCKMQTKFIKSKRTNKISKIVREIYLREDVACGIATCPTCRQENAILGTEIIILTAKAIEQQIDALESEHLKNMIIPMSQLELLTNVVQKRILNVVQQPNRHCHLYPDKFFLKVFIDRIADESKEQYEARKMQVLFEYFQKHLQYISNHTKAQFSLHLINPETVNEHFISLYDYAQLKHLDQVLDLISNSVQVEKDFEHKPHVLKDQMYKLIENKTAFIGKLEVSNYNCFQASIAVENENIVSKMIMVVGMEDMNRAMHGDSVAVEIYDTWNLMDETVNDDNNASDAPSKSNEKVELNIPKGRVIHIIKRNPKNHVCSLDVSKLNPNQLDNKMGVVVPCVPLDKKIPRIYIRTRQLKHLRGKRIIVGIDEWSIKNKFPFGHYIQTIGKIDDKESETMAILYDHEINNEPFSDAIIKEMPTPDWLPTLEDYKDRAVWGFEPPTNAKHLVDISNKNALVCSIDPPGCTDIDDTLHCIELSKDRVQIGVHIADVTHFVNHMSLTDIEAAKRGTTVYLVDRRIDMLPGVLGSNLCSLKENVLRLAFSVIWEINPHTLQVYKTTFCKSVVKSSGSFTYDQAQQRLDSKNTNDPITKSLMLLNQVARLLRNRRIQNGALTLASPEVRFKLENNAQDPVDLELKELKEANQLVEEYMLLANITVAERLYEYFPSFALLRCHPKPPEDNFKQVQQSLAKFGMQVNCKTSKQLADSLDKLTMVFATNIVTRCMYQAKYFSSGSATYDGFMHYGLSCPIYTHFTSPIRRYADVIVHRLLQSTITLKTVPRELKDKQLMKELCDNINYRNSQAQHASRQSVVLYTHIYFRGKDIQEDAYIMKITKNGIVLLIPKYGLESIAYFDDTQILSSKIDLENQSIEDGEGNVLRQLEKVRVKAEVINTSTNVDIPNWKLELTILEPQTNLFKSRKIRRLE